MLRPYKLRAALLFTSLLFGSVSAFAQKQPLPGLPSVNLGLPKVDLPLRIEPIRVDSPKLPLDVNVRVPSVGGLTPPLNATVGINTAGPLLEAGVNVGGSGPGAPPLLETSLPTVGAPQQVTERRLELLPTCR